jgi:hypothetical protein
MTLWEMDELVRLEKEAERKKDEPQLGIKQQQWRLFKPLSNFMIPLLYYEIGIGKQLLEKLSDIINKHIECYGPAEQITQLSIPVLNTIIANTAKLRDDWDASAYAK